jgi:hypothetical protein
MIVEAKARDIVSLFANFVKTNKEMFNFKVDGKTIEVQYLGDYSACTSIPVTSLDNDFKVQDISFWVTKAINILDIDSPITLKFEDSFLMVEQNTFSSTFVREHEERRSYPDVSSLTLKNAYANRLKYITHSLVSCMGLSKELLISDPDPMFSNGRVYADYMQTFFIEHLEYPEVCIPITTLRDFVYKLDEKATYAYLPDLNTLYFKSKDYEFWIPTTNYNLNASTINAIEKKMMETRKITEVTFKDYSDKLLTLANAFPKQRFPVAFGDHSFRVSLFTNNMQCTVGMNMNNSLLALNMTSGQIMVIAKLFKDDDVVEVLKGGNCICLKCGEKSILIAGMIC